MSIPPSEGLRAELLAVLAAGTGAALPDDAFDRLARAVFAHQFACNRPYRAVLRAARRARRRRWGTDGDPRRADGRLQGRRARLRRPGGDGGRGGDGRDVGHPPSSAPAAPRWAPGSAARTTSPTWRCTTPRCGPASRRTCCRTARGRGCVSLVAAARGRAGLVAVAHGGRGDGGLRHGGERMVRLPRGGIDHAGLAAALRGGGGRRRAGLHPGDGVRARALAGRAARGRHALPAAARARG